VIDLYTEANSLLTKAVALVTLPPTRQYVAPGVPAADCEQVTVHFSTLGPTTAFPAPAGPIYCAIRHAVVYCIQVVRCYPTFDDDANPPPVALLTTAAQQVLGDARAVYEGMLAHHFAGTLVERCKLAQFGAVEIVGPEGGFVATQLCLTVEDD
jgi:hypothetical protein